MTVGGTTAGTYLTDALGERVSKTASSTITHYIYDLQGKLIAEANGSTGATTKGYVYLENQPIAQIDSTGTYYVLDDQLGTPQKLTNASKALVWDRQQKPFGEDYATPTNTTPTNLRFPGQYADAESGLNQNGFRDYDPARGGRYNESDPLGLAAGPSTYAYVGGNPLKWGDRSGLCFEDACVGEVILATEAAEEAYGAYEAWRATRAAETALQLANSMNSLNNIPKQTEGGKVESEDQEKQCEGVADAPKKHWGKTRI